MPARRHTLVIGLVAAIAASVSQAQAATAEAQLIEQGQYWQARSNPVRAAEVWQKVLQIEPNQIDALYGMGLIGVKQNKPQQAQAYLARLQALSPVPWQAVQLEQDIALGQPQNQALLDEARRLADAGERDKATGVFRQLFNGRLPEGKVGREYYTNLGFNSADWPEARKGFERLMRQNPDDSILALFFAKHLARREDTRAEGIAALARLSTHPDIAGDADQSWRMALVWIGPPTAAQVPLFEAFLKAHPDDQDIRDQLNKGRQQPAGGWQQDPLVARGLKALERNDHAAAEQAFAARLKTKADDADALGGLGVVRQQQNRLAEAEQLLTRATRQPGGARWKGALESVQLWTSLQQARDLQAKGQTSKAQELLAQVQRQNPNSIDVRLTQADLQAQAGQLDAAQAGYRQVLATQRGNPQAVRGLINVLAQSGQADEALRLLDTLSPAEQAALGDSGRFKALRATQTARLAEQRGDLRAAQAALKDAVKNDPDSVWTRFDLARLYLKTDEAPKARVLIDELLKSRPNNIDALYTSALLSVEMGQWQEAQATFARIPVDQRTPDMKALADEVNMTVQINLAIGIARRGQRQEALALLDRLQPVASGSPERQLTLASAYIDAGEPERGREMARAAIAQAPAQSPDLLLQYASLLLAAEDDVQVNAILRTVQGQPMGVQTRKRFDDLLYRYRIRQADLLREGGDLAGAYDTLAPALAQRPDDIQAVSAFARMYTASGDSAKAFELYKPLLQRKPNDPQVLLGAADAAVKAHDYGFAEKALSQFRTLQRNDPQSLTEAARIYQSMGQTGAATELLRKAVAIEQSEKQRLMATQGGAGVISSNPFAASGSRGLAAASAIPAPAQVSLSGGAATDLPATRGTAYPGQSAAQQPLSGGRAQSVRDNPFLAAADRDQASSAQQALNRILEQRSGFVSQGLAVRSNNSESGLSKLTVVETPLEINVPAGDNRVAVRVTPVSLNAGSVKSDAGARFGGGTAGAAGSQSDKGVGLAVAFERPEEGLKADIGTTPVGFKYSTVAGGVSVDRPLGNNPDLRYGLNVSRRPVTDSVTSFAGSTDERSGLSWGGVTANGGRGQISYDDQTIGGYGYGSWHKLVGTNVKSNTRGEVGGGVYWYLRNAEDSKLTAGLSLMGMSYANDQSYFTYGHGGYFSPQNFYAIGVPVMWAQRTERFSYQVKSSVGVQHFKQDGAAFFPDDSALQAASGQRYSGQSKTGVGYNLSAAGEYKLDSSLFLGANLGLDNARDYRQFSGALYLRYMFEDVTGPMELPVSPYRSPYSN
ncbi:cellulose biosynthesis protein BcsC [Pseudomonas syringae]|uniref:cellulose biosynthesis protein BcsC n=1 Tax=Pseudomonas syringae TaxID=317 RepID=UPI0023FA1240|nr:cellulose biosynthesis protein BcsC [Pseudomonas syringae]MDF7795286.1 cellulose synthase subunit BcsC-related outer membrane protein [Pseudomonas syringae]